MQMIYLNNASKTSCMTYLVSLNTADDILVFGETYEEFKGNVLKFLDHCIEKELHLNADKFKLNCKAIPFFGHLLTKNGIKPDPKKVEAIT